MGSRTDAIVREILLFWGEGNFALLSIYLGRYAPKINDPVFPGRPLGGYKTPSPRKLEISPKHEKRGYCICSAAQVLMFACFEHARHISVVADESVVFGVFSGVFLNGNVVEEKEIHH